MGGLPTNRTVNSFAGDLENSKIMFVANRDGLSKSTDAGASWKLVGNEMRNVAAVAINPKKPSEIYVSTIDGTIYLSGDAGMKWKKQH